MERNRPEDTDSVLYRVGLISLLVVAAVAVIAKGTGISLATILGDTFGVCPFYRLTHLYCPACGGTRAVQAFLYGRLLASFGYNGFVCYMLTGYVIFMVSQTMKRLSKGRICGMQFHMYYIYAGLVIGLLQWIIKNAEVLM